MSTGCPFLDRRQIRLVQRDLAVKMELLAGECDSRTWGDGAHLLVDGGRDLRRQLLIQLKLLGITPR